MRDRIEACVAIGSQIWLGSFDATSMTEEGQPKGNPADELLRFQGISFQDENNVEGAVFWQILQSELFELREADLSLLTGCEKHLIFRR